MTRSKWHWADTGYSRLRRLRRRRIVLTTWTRPGEQDAKLIAAAPELADALSGLLAAIEKDNRNVPDAVIAAREVLREAGRLP